MSRATNRYKAEPIVGLIELEEPLKGLSKCDTSVDYE